MADPPARPRPGDAPRGRDPGRGVDALQNSSRSTRSSTHDVWVRASQVRPGNPAVVHHVVVFVLPPGVEKIDEAGGDFLAAYAPGMPPRVLPDGVAKRIPAGSRIVLQLHYTPRGTKQVDRSRIGLVFADPATVHKELMSGMALNFGLQIPPGAADYVSRADFRFGQPSMLLSLLPHMHLRGKSMRFVAEYPDGRREVILDVPRYEFDWQNLYVLDRAQADARGDDPPLPRPTSTTRPRTRTTRTRRRTVTFGEQTRDEMHVGYLNFALADQDLALGMPTSKRLATASTRSPSATAPPAGEVGRPRRHVHRLEADRAHHDRSGRPGRFSTTIVLGPGTHEYKFLIDGRPSATTRATPPAGFFHNSVIEVGKIR